MSTTEATQERTARSQPGGASAARHDDILPVVAMADTVVFPGSDFTLLLGTTRALGAIREAERCPPASEVVAVSALGTAPGASQQVGVVARVLGTHRHPSGLWLAELRAQNRVVVRQILRDRPIRLARVQTLADEPEPVELLHGLVAALRGQLLRLSALAPQCNVAANVLRSLRQACGIAEQVEALMGCMILLPSSRQQTLLANDRASERLEALMEVVDVRISTYPSLPRATI